MHITKSSEKITPFGGLNFCLEQFHHSGLAGLIDRQVGQRVQTVGFSYSEIIANTERFYIRAIMSNDHTTSAEKIADFYNKRGGSERTFDVMNNDFGWSRLPCSFLSENTAFMILTAMTANFYRYIIGLYSEKAPG